MKPVNATYFSVMVFFGGALQASTLDFGGAVVTPGVSNTGSTTAGGGGSQFGQLTATRFISLAQTFLSPTAADTQLDSFSFYGGVSGATPTNFQFRLRLRV